MLHQQIKEEVKKAMLAREEVKLRTVRGILAAFTYELGVLKRKPSEELTDDEALAVIKRQAKQHKDSIEQFQAGGRDDLVKKEEEELKIIEAYLPQTMSQEEIKPLAEAKKTELGITDKSKAGQLMSALMKDLKGRAEGTDVKAVVDSLLS